MERHQLVVYRLLAQIIHQIHRHRHQINSHQTSIYQRIQALAIKMKPKMAKHRHQKPHIYRKFKRAHPIRIAQKMKRKKFAPENHVIKKVRDISDSIFQLCRQPF